ncbi:MAG TPA: serine hydrolase, partial [Labilithrix sp.]|nr:serine hydrolase [Labilithrix sp.]
PEPLGDGWAIATPESVGLSSAVLGGIHAQLLREDRFPGSLGMLVVKDDKLVWETYLRRRGDRDHYQAVQSVTKSVTAIVFGMARERGFFGSLDETIATIFPDEMPGLAPPKPAISLRHLLTMSSGLTFDNVDFSLQMWTFHHDDPLRHILDKPLYAAPGARFVYRDADPQVVGYALSRRTGRTEHSLAAEWLFGPLGITDYYWDRGPDDGITMAAHGLHLRPRDLAKIGELVLDGGSWRGRRLVSAEWIAEMTRAQTTSETDDQHGVPFPYGYYWWIVPGGAAAWGNGGQYVVVVPAKRLLLVHVALPDTADMDGSHLGDFLELVAPLL